AEWLVRRGFAQQGAAGLAAWMASKVEADSAVGTVAVLVMGIVPERIFPQPWEESLLGRYLRAGGRVVWLGNVPMYVVQGETGSSGTYGAEAREQFLGLVSDRAAFYGAEGPPVLTETAKAWGLEPGPTLVRPVLNRG